MPHPADEVVLRFGPFRFSRRALTVLLFFDVTLFFVLAVLSAVRFFQVEETRLQIAYSAAFVTCVLLVVAIKLFYFLLMAVNDLAHRVAPPAE